VREHQRGNTGTPAAGKVASSNAPLSNINFSMESDPFLRGADYLNALRPLLLEPAMIDVADDINQRIRICTWIGQNIEAINADLNACLEACHSCFHPQDRQLMQIFAAPLAEQFGVDGLCNILVEPITILIDVGRINRHDWLSIVAHEYAHGHLRSPGHEQRFLGVIGHLCLGLGLEVPSMEGTEKQEREAWLRNWPHCASTSNSLAFWRGEICSFL
jgi:hypothetical protein